MALVESFVPVRFYRKVDDKVFNEGYKEFNTEDVEETDKIESGFPVCYVYITFDVRKGTKEEYKISPLRFKAVKHPTLGLAVVYSGDSIFK